MKKNKVKLKQIQSIRQLKLKGLQLNNVDKSNVYLIEFTTDMNELFIEKARMVLGLFKSQGIDVIVVPKNYMKIYKIGR